MNRPEEIKIHFADIFLYLHKEDTEEQCKCRNKPQICESKNSLFQCLQNK